MIYFYLVIGALLLGISEVLRYYVEPTTKSVKLRKKINTAWHIYRDLGILSYMILAWLLPKDLLQVVMYLPVLWIVHWILTDGIQNLIKGKDFFYTSPTSGNYVEKFGKWYIKLTLLVAGISLNIYLKDKYGKHYSHTAN